MRTFPRAIGGAIALVVLAGLLATAVLIIEGTRSDPGGPRAQGSPDELVRRGAYLVAAGDCRACHTTRGGVPFAGGLAMDTPFGRVYSTNLTADPETGLGRWSEEDFWRALHEGRTPGGGFLYPVFPFPNFTKVTRADADAIFAYLRTLPPQHYRPPANDMHFPFNLRPLLVFWRGLYFRPGEFRPDPGHDAAWNRGAYLVTGLGHCNACHADRNLLGATKGGLAGAQIPVMNWYAPSLEGNSEAGIKDWPASDLTRLLHDGLSSRAAVFGPMHEVVEDSLQYLTVEDVADMTRYLQNAPAPLVAVPVAPARPEGEAEYGPGVHPGARGAALYHDECQTCHGVNGEGSPGQVPPLAGNRAITMNSTLNPIRMVMGGGFAPVTQADPRPYGMPPFEQKLSDVDVAAVVSYIRSAFGNRAGPVAPGDVERARNVPED